MRTQNIQVPSVWEHAWCTSPWKQCSSPEKQSSGTCVRSDDQPRLAITVIDEIIEHSSSHTARWRRASQLITDGVRSALRPSHGDGIAVVGRDTSLCRRCEERLITAVAVNRSLAAVSV